MNAAKKNIVQFPVRKAFTMSLSKLDSFEGRKAIAKLLRDWERENKGNTFKALASKAVLHPNTVAKIANETTTWPRLHTIIAIMGAIGFQAVRFE